MLLVGAISPGPSFVLIARTSVALARIYAISASIGMGIGGVVYSVIAILRLNSVLNNIPFLYVALKVIGGLYLVYLAHRIWKGAVEPLLV